MKPKIIRHNFKYFLPISKKVLAKDATVWYNRYVADFEVWPSLVGRYVRDVEAAGSNPVIPTKMRATPLWCCSHFYFKPLFFALNYKKSVTITLIRFCPFSLVKVYHILIWSIFQPIHI